MNNRPYVSEGWTGIAKYSNYDQAEKRCGAQWLVQSILRGLQGLDDQSNKMATIILSCPSAQWHALCSIVMCSMDFITVLVNRAYLILVQIFLALPICT